MLKYFVNKDTHHTITNNMYFLKTWGETIYLIVRERLSKLWFIH